MWFKSHSVFSELFDLTPDDLVLCATALTFDPVMVELFTTLTVGACLLVLPPTVKVNPELFTNIVHVRNKVTVIQVFSYTFYF